VTIISSRRLSLCTFWKILICFEAEKDLSPLQSWRFRFVGFQTTFLRIRA